MDLHIIVPVKPFAEAKQRLSSALNPVQRATLAERMFRHVLGVAVSCFGAANVRVVSPSEDVLAIARKAGAVAVSEDNPSGLNSALSRVVRAAAGSRVLIVASDLPFLGCDDLAQMARAECAIGPDRRRCGTNALLWPADLPFAFGENSFVRHRAIAENAGLVPMIVVRRGLAHDIDVPEDLDGVEL